MRGMDMMTFVVLENYTIDPKLQDEYFPGTRKDSNTSHKRSSSSYSFSSSSFSDSVKRTMSTISSTSSNTTSKKKWFKFSWPTYGPK